MRQEHLGSACRADHGAASTRWSTGAVDSPCRDFVTERMHPPRTAARPARMVAWFGAVPAQEYGPASGPRAAFVDRTTTPAMERAHRRDSVLRTPTYSVPPGASLPRRTSALDSGAHQSCGPPPDGDLDGELGSADPKDGGGSCGRGDRSGLSVIRVVYRCRRELRRRAPSRRIAVRTRGLAGVAMHAERGRPSAARPRRGRRASAYALLADRLARPPRRPRRGASRAGSADREVVEVQRQGSRLSVWCRLSPLMQERRPGDRRRAWEDGDDDTDSRSKAARTFSRRGGRRPAPADAYDDTWWRIGIAGRAAGRRMCWAGFQHALLAGGRVGRHLENGPGRRMGLMPGCSARHGVSPWESGAALAQAATR